MIKALKSITKIKQIVGNKKKKTKSTTRNSIMLLRFQEKKNISNAPKIHSLRLSQKNSPLDAKTLGQYSAANNLYAAREPIGML